MKHQLLLLGVAVMLLMAVTSASAQSGGGYDLAWSTIDGGGDTSTGGDYALMGTIGQSDAGAAMNGNGFTLNGGFWNGGASQYRVYLPLMIK
jgi:hypothetical protein